MANKLPYPFGNYRFDTKRLRRKMDAYCDIMPERWQSIKNKIDAVEWYKSHFDMMDFELNGDKYRTMIRLVPAKFKNEVSAQFTQIEKIANFDPESFYYSFTDLISEKTILKERFSAFEKEMSNLWEKAGYTEPFYQDGKSMILYCWIESPNKYFPYLWHEFAGVWEQYGDVFKGEKMIHEKSFITRNTVTAQGFFYDLNQEIFRNPKVKERVKALLDEKEYTASYDYDHAITYDFAEYVRGV